MFSLLFFLSYLDNLRIIPCFSILCLSMQPHSTSCTLRLLYAGFPLSYCNIVSYFLLILSLCLFADWFFFPHLDLTLASVWFHFPRYHIVHIDSQEIDVDVDFCSVCLRHCRRRWSPPRWWWWWWWWWRWLPPWLANIDRGFEILRRKKGSEIHMFKWLF